MKVKNMPNGTILWNGYNILGIKGNTLCISCTEKANKETELLGIKTKEE